MPLFFEQHRARLLETVIETIKKLSELHLLVKRQGKHEAKKDIAVYVVEWNAIVV